MSLIGAKIRRFFHVSMSYLRLDFNTHQAQDYLHPTSIKVFGLKYDYYKTVHLRCKCGEIYYDKLNNKKDHEKGVKKSS